MSVCRLIGIPLLLLIALAVFQFSYGRRHIKEGAQWFAFNTDCVVVIECQARHQGSAQEAIREVIRASTALNNILNRFDQSSEVSRFNNSPANEPFHCSPELWQAFLATKRAYEITDGAFDVTIGPLMSFWKKAALTPANPPTLSEIAAAKALVGFNKLHFDPANFTVTKLVPGLSVDFGGIAKGFALDQLKALVSHPNFINVKLSLGGNIFLSDSPGNQVVSIKNPDSTQTAPLAYIRNCAGRHVATSSNGERPLSKGATPISHIINPANGAPATAMVSVTAVTATGADSDVFSTAVFVAGKSLAEKLCATVPGTGFLLLPPNSTTPIALGELSLESVN